MKTDYQRALKWRDAQDDRNVEWSKTGQGRVRVTYSGLVWWVETPKTSRMAYSLPEAMALAHKIAGAA